ncbi:MAG: exosortase C-terminal domain/associated protein EpsI [Vicinamibacterales bacterium]
MRLSPNWSYRVRHPFLVKSLIVSVCLLGGAGVLLRASKSEVVPVRVALAELPYQMGAWRGRPLADLPQDILDVLGVDEYVNRMYLDSTQTFAGLYIGYYASQRQGDTMHSPLNCLPGAGWIPVQQRRITIDVADRDAPRRIEVNSFVIEKGIERQAVLYWYQSHGRVVASEYWGKIYMVADAIRQNRTDGALVRVIVPIEGRTDADTQKAEQTAVAFVQELFPRLSQHLPS